MRSAVFIIVAFLFLSALSGCVKSLLLSLQHLHQDEPWVSLSYLAAVPTKELMLLVPGFIIGYFGGSRHVAWVLLLGIPAYYLQYTVGSHAYHLLNPPQIENGVLRLPNVQAWQTVVAYGISFSVASAVAVMGGAFMKNVRGTSNTSLQGRRP